MYTSYSSVIGQYIHSAIESVSCEVSGVSQCSSSATVSVETRTSVPRKACKKMPGPRDLQYKTILQKNIM